MARLTPNYIQHKREYIFPIIERKLEELRKNVTSTKILNFGIGDIALPLAPSVVEAISSAVSEMGLAESLRGYGPAEGYLFLREAIAANEYAALGIEAEEIFISDGINSDISGIQELFSANAIAGVPDPSYPVYLDTCILAGRRQKVLSLACTEKTGFVPKPPNEHCDFVYLCTPNNPTGVAMNRKELAQWVDYAKKEDAILLIDGAYAAFVCSPEVPRSIYEIAGAKEVAIEFKSFSKAAGFTGLRCAYTVLPKSVLGKIGRKKISLHSLWSKRQNIKSNGVNYPVQRGAEACFQPKAKEELEKQITNYLTHARRLRNELTRLGHTCAGGIDSPYIWWKTPNNLSSWEFFDLLLQRCQIIAVPGEGFGRSGQGYIRLSAFTTEDLVSEAIKRIATL